MSITPRFALALILSTVIFGLLPTAGYTADFQPIEKQTNLGRMLFSSDCTDMKEQYRDKEAEGLRLKAELVDDTVTLCSKVVLKLTTTNAGSTMKTIAECAPFMDFTLCIEDPYGTMTRIEWRDYGGRYRCIEHKLAAGESFSVEYVVSDVYDFAKVGIYHITAACKTIGQNGPGSAKPVSNAAELTVRPASDAAEIAAWKEERRRHRDRQLRPLWPIPNFNKGEFGAETAGFALSASMQLPDIKDPMPVFDITLTLSNISDQARIIYQSEPTATYFLCMEGATGTTLPGVHIKLTSVSHRVEIGPGEQVTDVFPVRGCFKIDKEGDYRIIAARLVPSLNLTRFVPIFSNAIDMHAVKNAKGELELKSGKQPLPDAKDSPQKQ